jgi:hypothetical protein
MCEPDSVKRVFLACVQDRLDHPSGEETGFDWGEQVLGTAPGVSRRQVYDGHGLANIQVITGLVEDAVGTRFLTLLGATAVRLSKEEMKMLSDVQKLAKVGGTWNNPGSGGANIEFRHAVAPGTSFYSSIFQLSSNATKAKNFKKNIVMPFLLSTRTWKLCLSNRQVKIKVGSPVSAPATRLVQVRVLLRA